MSEAFVFYMFLWKPTQWGPAPIPDSLSGLNFSTYERATLPKSGTLREGEYTRVRWHPDVSPTLAEFVQGHSHSEYPSSSLGTIQVWLCLSLSPCQFFPETFPMLLVRIFLFVFVLPASLFIPFLIYVAITWKDAHPPHRRWAPESMDTSALCWPSLLQDTWPITNIQHRLLNCLDQSAP